MEKSDLQKTIKLFYISKFLVGLRFFIPIWLIFGKHFLNLPQLGLLESAGYLLMILIDIPSGALADLIGRKKVIMAGWFFVALGHAGQGLSTSALFYIIWGLISTIAASLISGADTAYLYDTLKLNGKQAEFTKVNSYGLFINRMGIIVATFLGGFLYKIHSSIPFIFMGLAEFLSLFCWYYMKEIKVHSQKFSFTNYISQIKDGIRQVYKTSYTKVLSIFYIIIGGITFTSLYFFNYSYALDLGLNAMQQSVFFGITAILKALIVLVFAKYANKISRNKILFMFMIFMVVSYLPSMFVGNNIAIILITFTEILAVARFAFLDQFINDEFESKHRATALSFINMMVNIIYVLVVAVGGYIANSLGTGKLYSLLGVLIVISLVPVTLKLISYRKITLQPAKISE
jgi:MFS family permease